MYYYWMKVYKLRDVAKELRSLLDSRNDNFSHLQVKTDEVKDSFAAYSQYFGFYGK